MPIWMMVLALAQAAQAPTISLGEMRQGDSWALARRLLPEGIDGRIAGSSVHRVFFPGQVHYRLFWETPEPFDQGVCRRRTYGVRAQAMDAREDAGPETLLTVDSPIETKDQYAAAYPQGASAGRCAELKGWVTPQPDDGPDAVKALQRLSEAMAEARSGRRLTFDLSCESQDPADCADARAALAGLPLQSMIGISMRKGEVETGPAAEIQFYLSGSSPQAWRATLTGADRLRSVRLTRAFTVFH